MREPKTLGELDEAARDLSRSTGWGYERSMVELQRRDRIGIACERLTGILDSKIAVMGRLAESAARAAVAIAALRPFLSPEPDAGFDAGGATPASG